LRNCRPDTPEYATGCTFYFKNNGLEENKVRATYKQKNILLFSIKEIKNIVDIYIKFPKKFNCIHYKNSKDTKKFPSSDEAHLTYHGKPKKNKITGEIHIKDKGINPFKGKSDKVEAPLASSSNIKIYPLPICRIELSNTINKIEKLENVTNYFEVKTPKCYFNTIEVHLARHGFMMDLASVKHKQNIPTILNSLFINTSMHTFFLNKIERRPGNFPQVLVAQTNNYELIIIAGHEYKNKSYKIDSICYFYTKDYFKDLINRNIISTENGFFIDQRSNQKLKEDAIKLSTILKSYPKNLF
ncbi:MAG: hypothetical protein KKB09_07965, partial [Nanoarchaeota archaeon]|nr:hypothetical protein [Nanoarchaeota archaeon]